MGLTVVRLASCCTAWRKQGYLIKDRSCICFKHWLIAKVASNHLNQTVYYGCKVWFTFFRYHRSGVITALNCIIMSMGQKPVRSAQVNSFSSAPTHDGRKHLQSQFIDAWHQNRKSREIYFWMNNIYSWVGLSLCNIWTIMEWQRSLVNMAMI